ncbi:MAG: hypothetical protein ABFR53_13740, partial [Actinomycetota bacterium]
MFPWRRNRKAADSEGQQRASLAMLHVGRCGSTVVGRMLSDHPDVFWDREIFEPHRRTELDEPVDLPPNQLIRHRQAQTPLHYGFETKYLQSHHLGRLGLTLPDYISILQGLGFNRFVALHRRNYLRRVVSGAIGRASGTWHRTRGSATTSASITLDPHKVPFGPRKPLLDVFAELSEGERALRELLPPSDTLWLTYEDDIERDPSIAYRRVCGLFGV